MIQMKYCKICVLPNTRPNIFFNLKSNTCSVCNSLIINKQKINWKLRKRKFLKLVKITKKKIKFMIALYLLVVEKIVRGKS